MREEKWDDGSEGWKRSSEDQEGDTLQWGHVIDCVPIACFLYDTGFSVHRRRPCLLLRGDDGLLNAAICSPELSQGGFQGQPSLYRLLPVLLKPLPLEHLKRDQAPFGLEDTLACLPHVLRGRENRFRNRK